MIRKLVHTTRCMLLLANNDGLASDLDMEEKNRPTLYKKIPGCELGGPRDRSAGTPTSCTETGGSTR